MRLFPPLLRIGFILVTLAATCLPHARAQDAPAPLAVRNDLRRVGEQVLVFRHQRIHKGGHGSYYRISVDGVWPWFEKIGTRVVGQWKVIHPDGSAASPDYDDGYRLARYASYEHWKATRRGRLMGGNGPDYQKNMAALKARNHYVLDSDGAYFLQGPMATIEPYYMPALEESYEPVESTPDDGVRPVRNDRNWPADREIIALDRWRIDKGSADDFIRAGVSGVWPLLEKVGARPVGQWKVIYPPESGHPESPDYDEVFMMTRYAGYEHWRAARPETIVHLAGDGNDYQAYRDSHEQQRELTHEHSVTFLEGYLHQSPPFFLPGLREKYRKTQ